MPPFICIGCDLQGVALKMPPLDECKPLPSLQSLLSWAPPVMRIPLLQETSQDLLRISSSHQALVSGLGQRKPGGPHTKGFSTDYRWLVPPTPHFTLHPITFLRQFQPILRHCTVSAALCL